MALTGDCLSACRLFLLLACFAPAVCARPPDALPASEHASLDPVRLEIRGARGSVAVRAEIAATVAQRSQGLMERLHLPPDAGMLFLYREPQGADAGFWMYRTRIPLDIAFLDGEGRILTIVAMEPCRDPVASGCPIYAPGVPYRAALEVNRGFFVRNGIAVGDRVRPPPDAFSQGGE